MFMFILAMFCLTTSNLPWFMDLTFQVPVQYCSLQHLTLFPSASTTGHCFPFGSVSSFILELFLHSSPVAYWAPTYLGSSSFSILSFCHFILFIGFSRQEYWSGLPFPSPVDHILLDLSTMTRLSWVAPQAWLSFIELDKAVVLVWLDWLVGLHHWLDGHEHGQGPRAGYGQGTGMLQSTVSQRVGHNWATELNWISQANEKEDYFNCF